MTFIPFLKRLGWVVACAIVFALPAALFISSKSNTPIWYMALQSIFSALGIGLFAIAIGAVALIAGRSRPRGGLKPALIITSIVSLLSCYAVISTQLRVAAGQ